MQTRTKALLFIGALVLTGFFARRIIVNALVDTAVFYKEKTRRAVVHRYPYYIHHDQIYYLVDPVSTPEYSDEIVYTPGIIDCTLHRGDTDYDLTELLKGFAGPCGDFHVGCNDTQPTVYDLLHQAELPIDNATPLQISVTMLTDDAPVEYKVTTVTTLASLTERT